MVLGAGRSGSGIDLRELWCIMCGSVEHKGFVGIGIVSDGGVLCTYLSRGEVVIVVCMESWVGVH